MITRHASRVRSRLLRGERCPLARSPEAQRSGTLPRQNIAIHVGDRHNGVVEGRLHVAQPVRNVLALLLLEGLFLPFLSGAAVPPAAAGFAIESFSVPKF